MRGHWRPYGDRIRVWYDLGPDPVTGKRRQRTKTVDSVEEAETFLEEANRQRDEGVMRDPLKPKTKVESFVDTYLEARRVDLRPSSWESLRSRLQTHVTPRLGRRAVGDVTPDLLSVMYQRMLAEGVSASTVRKVNVELHGMFTHALRWKYVTENPCDGVIVPDHQPAERETWTAEQVQMFLTGIETHPLRIPLLLSATTGMRRGEVCGVTWDRIDFEGRRIAVEATKLEVGGRILEGAPKTRRGKRHVSIPAGVAEALRVELLEAKKRRLATGEWSELVCDVRPGQLTKTFRRICEQLDLPYIKLHGLRHTWGTVAVGQGVDVKTVSDALGHASVRFTLDTYAHKVEEAHQTAADRMGEAFGV